MALETGTYINSLNASNPASTDGVAQADDHIRLVKATVKATLPNVTGAITATQAELNLMDGVTATTAELNITDGLVASTAELNKLDGLTASTAELNITDGLTASTSEINKLDGLTASTSELNHVGGVTSNIQSQLNNIPVVPTQATSTWEAGTSTTESTISPAKLKATIGNQDAQITENGYQKFPSGLILQWGRVHGVNAEQVKTVTLPIAFPNAIFTLHGTPNDVSRTGDFEMDKYSVGCLDTGSLTSFEVINEGTGAGNNKTMFWQATGY